MKIIEAYLKALKHLLSRDDDAAAERNRINRRNGLEKVKMLRDQKALLLSRSFIHLFSNRGQALFCSYRG